MTKLNFPESGIYQIIVKDNNSIINYINNAISNANIKVPHYFRYNSYIQNLENNLQKLNKELKDVELKAKKVDDNFDNSIYYLNSNLQKINLSSITKREKII